MDSDLSGLVDVIVRALGLEGTSLLAILAAVSLICRLVGKSIPDDAIGWKGITRQVCKVIGLYTSNRVTSGVSVTDVTKVLLDSKLPDRNDLGQFASQTVEAAARKIK